jgi:hypothetical protein
MVGALPGGGWNFLAEVAGAPVLHGPTLLLACVLSVLIGVIGLGWARQSAHEPRAETERSTSVRPTLILVAALVTFWVSATAAHSVTLKTITEIQHPGQVYLFYAVGVVVVAVLIALLLTVVVRRARGGAVLMALTPVIGLFVLTQVALNMMVADAIERNYPQNAPLVALSTDGHASADVRCAVLAAWVAEPWPQYYVDSVVEDLQENYDLEFGRPFCDQKYGRTP